MVYFVVTENCDLQCPHCYISAGPGKEDRTISKENFRKVIRNLPKRFNNLDLTGGEVFTIEDRLYEFLEIILEEKQRDKKDFDVVIQTNGSWATSEERAKEVYDNLRELGVWKIDVSSQSNYHPREKLRKRKEALEAIREYKGIPRISIREDFDFGKTKKNVPLPIGRGKEISGLDGLYHSWGNCVNALKDRKVRINYDGGVSLCSYGLFPLKGNVTEEPLEKILARAEKNPLMSSLDRGGIAARAKIDGIGEEKIQEEIEKYGDCGFCCRNYQRFIRS